MRILKKFFTMSSKNTVYTDLENEVRRSINIVLDETKDCSLCPQGLIESGKCSCYNTFIKREYIRLFEKNIKE